MRLLLDHNISPRIVGRLKDLSPDIWHVSMANLDRAGDSDVWLYARDNGDAMVTNDADFNEFVVMRGYPPKVAWLRMGNCTTDQVEAALRREYPKIVDFISEPTVGVLVLV